MALLRNMVLAATLLFLGAGTALATNGMLMEGYGPISHAMGGASMAFDNGAAAMVNNPATLGLMSQDNRVDVMIGHLRPDVTFKMGENNYGSDSTAFFMPAVGYVKKTANGLMVWASIPTAGWVPTTWMTSICIRRLSSVSLLCLSLIK